MTATLLAVAPQVWSVGHDAVALTEVIAEHEAGIAAHGHAHDDLDLRQHAFDHHWFEITDSDQSSGWLALVCSAAAAVSCEVANAAASTLPRDGPVRPFERPPRA